MNILEVMDRAFNKTFKRTLRHGDTWQPHKAFLSALFGLPLEGDGLEMFRQFTGRQNAPSAAFSEALLLAGRRSGKTLLAALVVVFMACFRTYSEYLAPGETPVCLLLAADKKQAQVAMRYIRGLLQVPMLARLVVRTTRERIELANGVNIEIHSTDFRSVRGRTLVCAVMDELCFWRDELSANPVDEILAAVRPSLATIPGSLLLGISSPYSKSGTAWKLFQQNYGKDEAPTLVWKAATKNMNATVNPLTIAAARLLDPAAARSEWDAEFRDDISNFLPQEVVEGCVVPHRFELPYVPGKNYVGFTDPAGGSGGDSYTAAIAHLEGEAAILDVLREIKPPFSPEAATASLTKLFREYHISSVKGDAYAGEWPREQHRKHRVEYEVSDLTRSEIYLETLPLLNSGRCALLDSHRLVSQLCSLERRTARSGKDSVDHPVGGHDDLANAACGAITHAARSGGGVLGLVKYEQMIATGAIADPTRSATVLERVRARQEQISEDAGTCPHCGSALLVKLAFGELRCQMCARQFAIAKLPGLPESFRRKRA